MTQPIPSSSGRKRSLSDAPAPNQSRPKKKRVDSGPDTATMHSNAASSRDKKKRKKKKRRLSITAQGEELPVVAEIAPGSADHISPTAIHASSGSTPDPGRYANSRRTFIHGRRQLPPSAKVKGKRKAVQGTASPPPQLATGDAAVEEEKAEDVKMSEPGRLIQVATDGSAAIIARLGRELEENKKLLSAHKNTLTSLTNSLTCQICVDLMHKPYLLTPCGHLACHNCLVRWFTEPRDGGGNTVPPGLDIPLPETTVSEANPSQANPLPLRRLDYIRRPKTCPHCRARIHSRPVEVYGVKAMVNTLAHSGLASGFSMAPDNDGNMNRSEADTLGGASSLLNEWTNKDPWAGIFPPVHSMSGMGLLNALTDLPFYNGGRWPGPHVTLDDDTPNEGDQRGAPSVPVETLDTHGFHDREDGVYRCVACMHEIWDGVCSNYACGRIYTGHNIDDESDVDHWLGGANIDDDSESSQGNRTLHDILRDQFGLDDEDSDSLYADFTEDERNLMGPLGGTVAHSDQPPSDVEHPQYRVGYRVGHDDGYNEGYDEGFEEGLVEGRYESGSRPRVRVPLIDEDDEDEDDDDYEGSFIDDDDNDHAGDVFLSLGPRHSTGVDEDVDIDDDAGSDQVRGRTSRRTNILVSDDEEPDDDEDDEDEYDNFPVIQSGRSRRLAVLSVSSDSDS